MTYLPAGITEQQRDALIELLDEPLEDCSGPFVLGYVHALMRLARLTCPPDLATRLARARTECATMLRMPEENITPHLRDDGRIELEVRYPRTGGTFSVLLG